MWWDEVQGVGGGHMPPFGAMLMIEPLAFQRVFIQGKGVLPEVTAGPANDAVKQGLPMAVVDGVAVIPVIGMTNKRWRASGFLSSYIATSAAVRAAAADPKVDTIMLKIDSPGGFVSGIAETADDIQAASRIKRTVAQIDGMGASAAYWLASQAREIYAGRLDDVGSIGVLAVLYDFSKAFEKEGVKPEVFSTGKYKWTGVAGTALTDEQRKYIQDEVDTLGDAFVADVARGRRMLETDVRKVADGRTFSAPEALKRRLIDGVQTYDQTLSMLTSARQRDTRMRMAKLDAAKNGL